jgi:hypothetical protein
MYAGKHRPYDVPCEFADNMSTYSVMLAYAYMNGIWQRSVGVKKFPFLFQAILHDASCDYHLHGCIGANVMCGAKHLDAVNGVDESLLIWWRRHRPSDVKWQYMFASHRLATCHVFDSEWEHMTAVQFITVMPEEVTVLRKTLHDIPNLGGMYDGLDDDFESRGLKREHSVGSINPRPSILRCLPDGEDPGDKRKRAESDLSGNLAPRVAPCLSSSGPDHNDEFD